MLKVLTVQCKHWWNSLAVRYSSWIRYTVLPQVGEVVRCGQDYAVYFRPSPDLRGHGGTDQDPSSYTDYKADDLHVHHHSPVAHDRFKVEPPDREKANQRNGTAATVQQCLPWKFLPQWQTETQTRKRLNVVCVHHHMFCLERWGSLGNVFVVGMTHTRLPAWVQFCLAHTSDGRSKS